GAERARVGALDQRIRVAGLGRMIAAAEAEIERAAGLDQRSIDVQKIARGLRRAELECDRAASLPMQGAGVERTDAAGDGRVSGTQRPVQIDRAGNDSVAAE